MTDKSGSEINVEIYLLVTERLPLEQILSFHLYPQNVSLLWDS